MEFSHLNLLALAGLWPAIDLGPEALICNFGVAMASRQRPDHCRNPDDNARLVGESLIHPTLCLPSFPILIETQRGSCFASSLWSLWQPVLDLHRDWTSISGQPF